MEIAYKRTSRQSFMVIKGEYEPWGYEKRMIEENSIDVLLDFNENRIDGSVEFWYDISGKRSASDFFSQEGVSAYTARLFFIALQEALNKLDKYLINDSVLLLSEDTVFISNDMGHNIYLCPCPIAHPEFGGQIRTIMERLVKEVDPKSPEDVRIIYELFDVSLKKGSRISDYLDVFDEGIYNAKEEDIEDIEEDIMEEDIIEDIEDWEKFDFVEEKKVKKEKRGFKLFGRLKKRKKELFPSNEIMEDFIYDPFFEADAPESIGEAATTFLSLEDCSQRKLIYKGNKGYEDMYIENDIFRIGSKAKGNEGVIENPVISRYHAKIVKKGKDYFIEDLNSKNGTTVNGTILGYHEQIILRIGDRISFADVPYQFL